MSVIWFWVGVVGAVSGAIFYFVLQNKALKSLLVAVLFFGGIFCASFFSGGAQKKLKVLMQEQMGDFFRAEWEKAFGPDIHTQEMCIDEPFMRAHHLLDGKWEECTVENFHEGDHGGIHFSAANVQLDHVYQRGCSHDGYETCRKMVFKGIVLRCRTWVPVPSPVLANVRTEDSPCGVLTGKKILVAEDNELNAEIAIELLKEEGILTDWAKDGQECCDMLGQAEDGYYALILMDIQMPRLNGYEATAKIRQMENRKKAAIPIIAMTANAFAEDIQMAKNAGMNGHIAKPLDGEKMITVLKQCLADNSDVKRQEDL